MARTSSGVMGIMPLDFTMSDTFAISAALLSTWTRRDHVRGILKADAHGGSAHIQRSLAHGVDHAQLKDLGLGIFLLSMMVLTQYSTSLMGFWYTEVPRFTEPTFRLLASTQEG